jgi:hypothetical protein
MNTKVARFLFNAVVGVGMIVAGSLFAVLGFLGLVTIIAAPQGIGLLLCAAVLYACGARLVVGALLGE